MLAPTLIDDAQHDLALDLAQHVRTQFFFTLLIMRVGICHHKVVNAICAVTSNDALGTNC